MYNIFIVKEAGTLQKETDEWCFGVLGTYDCTSFNSIVSDRLG